MNKFNKKIILAKTKLVQKLASQIKPFTEKSKKLTNWYVSHGKSLLEVKNDIKYFSRSKTLKLFYALKESGSLETNPHGDLFYEKFTMFLFCINKLDTRALMFQYYDEYIRAVFKD